MSVADGSEVIAAVLWQTAVTLGWLAGQPPIPVTAQQDAIALGYLTGYPMTPIHHFDELPALSKKGTSCD